MVGVLLAAALTATSCSAKEPEPRLTAADIDRMLGPVDVAYYVEGSAKSVSVTAESPTGTQQGDTGVPLMNKQGTQGLHFKFSRGDFVYVSAQNQDGYGSVTCRIEADGRVISENTSSGGYSIATCKGTAN